MNRRKAIERQDILVRDSGFIRLTRPLKQKPIRTWSEIPLRANTWSQWPQTRSCQSHQHTCTTNTKDHPKPALTLMQLWLNLEWERFVWGPFLFRRTGLGGLSFPFELAWCVKLHEKTQITSHVSWVSREVFGLVDLLTRTYLLRSVLCTYACLQARSSLR